MCGCRSCPPIDAEDEANSHNICFLVLSGPVVALWAQSASVIHAGLWPEQGLQPVGKAFAFRRWLVTKHRKGPHAAVSIAKCSQPQPL
jgi:hypothetical protein